MHSIHKRDFTTLLEFILALILFLSLLLSNFQISGPCHKAKLFFDLCGTCMVFDVNLIQTNTNINQKLSGQASHIKVPLKFMKTHPMSFCVLQLFFYIFLNVKC